eukprot:scaffold4060_cov190-Amphora_coffeaeformis.AAC.18
MHIFPFAYTPPTRMPSSTMKQTMKCCLFLLCLLVSPTFGFVVPTRKSLIAFPTSSASGLMRHTTTQLSASPTDLSAVMDTAVYSSALSSSSSLYLSNDVVDILKNFGLVVGVLVIVLVGFLTLFSTVIIPQAAEQLETQAKRDFPDLWDDIAATNLQPGEQLVQRPDIMQKLGTAVRERLTAEFDQAAKQQQQQEAAPSTTTAGSSSSSSSKSRVVDAEVVQDDGND